MVNIKSLGIAKLSLQWTNVSSKSNTIEILSYKILDISITFVALLLF